ncbi:right-handed parallel beta-helix repeat-containing protein [Cellulomonas alba]|uniref:Right handed beta helix domain-containing protein n=1 Tax=Cellulomonas alba TaxID=3053467 RepID=A0ABT7SHC1_9CELL|nr:hypothetical protein [Cellulomonas alba]MDM7855573.1 hypothetical protein [Cellulomonas alba]
MVLQPLRARRARVVAVAGFVAGLLAGAFAIAAPLAEATSGTVTVNARVLVNRVVAPGATVVVPLPVPDAATSAKLVVAAQLAWRPTQVVLCPGAVVTATCKAKPAMTTPVKSVKYANVTLDLTKAKKMVAVYSSAASVSVTIRLESYTVPAATTPTPTATATPSAAKPTATPSATATATAKPTATPTATPKPTATPTATPKPTATPTATPKPTTTPAPAPTPSPTPSAPSAGSSGGSAPTPAGFPSAATTGVPAGTALTVHDGDLTITKAGTVLDATEVRGIVYVQAPDVVIKRSKIVGRPVTSSLALVMVTSPSYSVTIQDSELYAKDPSPNIRGVIGQNFTLERVNIHDVTDQAMINGNNVTIRDSWFHNNLHWDSDPNFNGGPSHDDNVQISVGKNITLVHNTFEGSHNAALMVAQDAGTIGSVNVQGNSFGNGSCSVNLAEKSRGPLAGFVFHSNVFQRTQASKNCAMIVDTTSIGLLDMLADVWSDTTPIAITPRS